MQTATYKARQLAAIMFTDIEGYTALMQRDEALALRIRERHRFLFDHIITRHDGRVLQYYGDGTLSIFNSVINAVNCGIELQNAFQENPPIPVRIGLHCGDVSMVGDEIIGDGVNIAARIEALATPGSLLISQRIYDEIKNQPTFQVKSLGDVPLKNVKHPVAVYALQNEGLVVPEQKAVQRVAREKLGKKYTSKTPYLIATALLAFLLAFLTFKVWEGGWLSGEKEPKSIAVLPFANMSNDPGQDYFSDGMTDDLLTQLTKIKDIRVVSRTSVMRYKNTTKPARTIAAELGVTHLLEGSVRKDNDQVRISVSLIEAAEDRPIWSVEFDRNLSDVLDVQREVSLEVVGRLEARLTDEEKNRVERVPTTNQEAYDYYQRGINLVRRNQGTVNQIDEAVRLLKEAVRLDPEFSVAFVGLAEAYLSYVTWGRRSPRQALPTAMVAALRAKQIDPESGDLFHTLGAIHLQQRDYELAREYLNKALEISPNYVESYYWLGLLNLVEGNRIASLQNFREAQKLDPLSTMYPGFMVWVNYSFKKYDEALQVANRALQDYPADNFVLWTMANAYVGKGDFESGIATFTRRAVGTQTNWALGYAYGKNGQLVKAREILDHQLQKYETQYVPEVMISALYVGLNDTEKALEWLEIALKEGVSAALMSEILIGPKFDPLRSNARFIELLEKANVQLAL